MNIEIRNRAGELLFSGEAQSTRECVEQAVKAGANLAGANLAGANLAGAYLAGAYLDGANLARANLDGANLARANLDGANLAGANLAGAKGVLDWLAPIRDDVRTILSACPAEVPGLLAALREGRVDGSTYTGECACLVGTIANVRRCTTDDLQVRKDSSSLAEQWYARIRPGHTPLNSTYAAMAALWCEEFLRERAEAELARLREGTVKP